MSYLLISTSQVNIFQERCKTNAVLPDSLNSKASTGQFHEKAFSNTKPLKMVHAYNTSKSILAKKTAYVKK